MGGGSSIPEAAGSNKKDPGIVICGLKAPVAISRFYLCWSWLRSCIIQRNQQPARDRGRKEGYAGEVEQDAVSSQG
jgi:hypothetical protein